MKNLNSILLTVLIVAFSISTASAKTNESIIKDYEINSFKSVSANTVADIVYTQCDNVIVKAQGAQEMLNNLKVSVKNGVLTIENDREFNDKLDEPLTIYLSSPSIESIETRGCGDWNIQSKVKSDNLVIKSEGIGAIHASSLESKKISVKYAGIGNLKLGGTTDVVEINSDGVGNIDCKNLISKTAMVKSTKIGKVKCFASESVGLFNDGIGEIIYHGNPTFKNLQNGGMGVIKEVK